MDGRLLKHMTRPNFPIVLVKVKKQLFQAKAAYSRNKY